MQGKATDNASAVKLLVTLDPTGPNATLTDLTSLLGADGNFLIDAAQLTTLGGGTLADGAQTLRLVAEDAAGNRSGVTDLAFTLDTAAPSISTVGLSVGSDTGTLGDGITAAARVTLPGTTEAGVTVSLDTISALAGAGGVFQLPDVALAGMAPMRSTSASRMLPAIRASAQSPLRAKAPSAPMWR